MSQNSLLYTLIISGVFTEVEAVHRCPIELEYMLLDPLQKDESMLKMTSKTDESTSKI